MPPVEDRPENIFLFFSRERGLFVCVELYLERERKRVVHVCVSV